MGVIENWKLFYASLSCGLPWSPKFPMALHRYVTRLNQRWENHNSPFYILLKFIYHGGKFLSVTFRKVTIEEDALIDMDVWISPKGNIILGPKTLGSGCHVHHNVTIGFGFGYGREMKRPEIGNNVWIGPGAIIYGAIRIGDGAVICPGAVVNKHVPPRCVVGGNPLKLLHRNIDNQSLSGAACESAYTSLLKQGRGHA